MPELDNITDLIMRRVEAGDEIEDIDDAISAQWPELTPDDRRAAYQGAADLIKRRAERLYASAAREQREGEQSYAAFEELCEISLETGIPLRPDTVMSKFVRKAAATGNKRAMALLDQLQK